MVANQVGVPRNVPGSSYDGMMILSKEQLTASIAKLSDELKAESVSTEDGIRLDWSDSWLLLRGSNTEPIVRLIAETPSDHQSKELIARAKAIIAN